MPTPRLGDDSGGDGPFPGAGGRPHPLSSLELCQGGALLTLIDELCHSFLPHPTPSSGGGQVGGLPGTRAG